MWSRRRYFYPRSPCGERPSILCTSKINMSNFYPRSPCGERLPKYLKRVLAQSISIHALLAESDPRQSVLCRPPSDFYPRSPCGERPRACPVWSPRRYFYPRSPCGERPRILCMSAPVRRFLSTLSLRRATQTTTNTGTTEAISIHALLAESDRMCSRPETRRAHFYPRSPCGERH